MINSNFIQVELSESPSLRALQLSNVVHVCKERFCGKARNCPDYDYRDPLRSMILMQSWALRQDDNMPRCSSGFPHKYNPGPTYFDAEYGYFVYHCVTHLSRWIVPHVPVWLMAIGTHMCIKYLPDDSLVPSIIEQLECSPEHALMIVKVN
jgi:hypothetical protein